MKPNSNEYKNFLSSIPAYKDYTFPSCPIRPFIEVPEKNQIDIDRVKLYCFNRSTLEDYGYVGVFSWKNKTIVPLDGDTYSKDTLIYGYKFYFKENKTFLNIIVDEENW